MQFSNCVARSSENIWQRNITLYRYVPHYVKLCTWYFACGLIMLCQSNCSWLTKHIRFKSIRSYVVSCVAQKCLTKGHETLQEFWSACVVVHLGDLPVELFSICRVIALNLVKMQFSIYITRSSNFPRVMNLISMWSTSGWSLWLKIYSFFFWSYYSWNRKKWNFQLVHTYLKWYLISSLESFQGCRSACVVVMHLWVCEFIQCL
jgi:hypothetical protein